jgi:Ca-activated chloride channel homolog
MHRSYNSCLSPGRHFWGTHMQKVVRRGAGCESVRHSLRAFLKAGRRVADSSFVQRSTLIAGILLASSGVMLAGVGYWVSGGFDYLSAVTYDVPAGFEHGNATHMPSGLSGGGSVPGAAGPSSLNAAYTIRKNVPEVRLQFTVADEHGRLIPDLAVSDLRIFDDHVPVDHIKQFQKMSDLPLRVGLLLDVSDSMKRTVEQEKSVALAFLHRVVRPGADRAFVMAFGDTVQIFQDPTSEVADLIGAVKQAKGPGESTQFFDAVYSGCVNQWKATERGPVHRVMIVISDGDDTGSRHVLDDVIAAAQRSEIQIYTLNLHLRKRTSPGDGVLQKLADETGGRSFIANNAREADAIFSELEQELRTQYYVSFRPQDELPGYHALQVEVQAPKKMLVHARHGYYALNQ